MTERTLAVNLPGDTIYVSGTVNGAAAVWTNVEGNRWEAAAPRAPDDIYMVALTLTSAGGTTRTVEFTLYYGVLNLITDRTAKDARRLAEIMRLPWDEVSAADREWFLLGRRRSDYGWEDLNRVGAALHFVADKLAEYAYNVQINARVDWTRESDFRMGDLLSYLADVERLRAGLAHFAATPETPDNIKTPEEANAVEQIILDVYELLQNMLAAFFYCGEPYSGEM